LNYIRRSAVAIGCALAVTAGGALQAGDAEAGPVGYVYIAFPKSKGNCGPAGKVWAIKASVGATYTSTWDYGDDLIYAKVTLKQSQSVSAQVWCSQSKPKTKPSRFLMSHAVSQNIKPTRNNQTVFVGPAGVSYN
jgi:hypothetical protein